MLYYSRKGREASQPGSFHTVALCACSRMRHVVKRLKPGTLLPLRHQELLAISSRRELVFRGKNITATATLGRPFSLAAAPAPLLTKTPMGTRTCLFTDIYRHWADNSLARMLRKKLLPGETRKQDEQVEEALCHLPWSAEEIGHRYRPGVV